MKPGHIHGETDDYSYNIVRDPVHIHDLNATILHLLGIDHTQLTYRFQGRDYRLTMSTVRSCEVCWHDRALAISRSVTNRQPNRY